MSSPTTQTFPKSKVIQNIKYLVVNFSNRTVFFQEYLKGVITTQKKILKMIQNHMRIALKVVLSFSLDNQKIFFIINLTVKIGQNSKKLGKNL